MCSKNHPNFLNLCRSLKWCKQWQQYLLFAEVNHFHCFSKFKKKQCKYLVVIFSYANFNFLKSIKKCIKAIIRLCIFTGYDSLKKVNNYDQLRNKYLSPRFRNVEICVISNLMRPTNLSPTLKVRKSNFNNLWKEKFQ
jgi:hypothetical protein